MRIARSTMLALILALLGFLAAGPAMFMHPQTVYTGIQPAPATALVHRNVVIVETGSPAFRAGLRTGDVVGCLSRRDYTYSFNPVFQRYAAYAAGNTISLCAERGGESIPIRFAAETRPPAPLLYGSDALALVRLLEYVAFLVCGVILVIGRPGPLTWLLFAFCLGSGPDALAYSNLTLLPPPLYYFYVLIVRTMDAAAPGFLLLFTLLVPDDRARGARLFACRLAWAVLACDIVVNLAIFGQQVLTVDSGVTRTMETTLDAIVLVALVARIARMTTVDRGRFGWAAFAIVWGLVANNLAHSDHGALTIVAAMLTIVTPVTLLYAILSRHVFDVRFALGRGLVFASLSGVVVASFVLLEWLLGTVLVDASHTTGIAANAGLALALGLGMSFLHKRIDTFIDAVFFRERHENERALRAFAREAAFVTDAEVLLDLAIERLRRHTDASAAAILLGERAYRVERWYGEPPMEIDENDGIVLTLKATQKAADPHRHDSLLAGELAVPMVARGHLIGIIACAARPSGETYAQDEIEALTEFAHGVGGALAMLERTSAEGTRDDAILAELRSLRAAFDRA